jgi:hypothetical protein
MPPLGFALSPLPPARPPRRSRGRLRHAQAQPPRVGLAGWDESEGGGGGERMLI